MPYAGTGNYEVAAAGGGAVDITVGVDAPGSLTFSSGSYQIAAGLAVGIAAYGTAYGVLRLTGGTDITFASSPGFSPAVDVAADLSGEPGVNAYGYLDVGAGSRLISRNDHGAAEAYANFRVGTTPGSAGQISVDGVGALLSAEGAGARINLGLNGGEGSLVVLNGARAQSLGLQVGANGGVGQAYLSGSGSTLTLSSAYGAYADPAAAGQSGAAVFGSGTGAGFLGVINGARFRVTNVDGETDGALVRFGRDNGSRGDGVVTGAGSVLEVIQAGAVGDDAPAGATLLVGEGGFGRLLLDDNALATVTGEAARLAVANGRYTGGAPDVTVEESLLSLSGGADLVVDSQGFGGATLLVGGGLDATGRLTAAGFGTTIAVTGTATGDDPDTGQLILGVQGTGAAELSEGATLTARNLELARGAGATLLVGEGG
ncbi:MAG: hypothetical protein AAGI70_11505, partial [Pseudomonadota bacterium]